MLTVIHNHSFDLSANGPARLQKFIAQLTHCLNLLFKFPTNMQLKLVCLYDKHTKYLATRERQCCCQIKIVVLSSVM